MIVDCFLLAGGRSPWLAAVAGTEHRCLAELGGQRLLDYILQALRGSGCIRKLVVAAEPEALARLEGTLPEGVGLCAACGDLAATSLAAAEALGAESTRLLLGVCDDIPLLTAQAVREFLTACEQYPEGQLFYPIITKAACLAAYPEARRTYGRLAEGSFTGGNMMLVDREAIPGGQRMAQEIFARRKSPLKLCNWLGWSFIFKLLLHRLTIAEAERRTSELLQLRCRAIVTEQACIGMDIDKPADWELAGRILG